MVKYEDDRPGGHDHMSGVIGGGDNYDNDDFGDDGYYEEPSRPQKNERPQTPNNPIDERIRQSLVRHVQSLMDSVVLPKDPSVQLSIDTIAAQGNAPLSLSGRQVAHATVLQVPSGARIGNAQLGLPPENLQLPSSELYVSLGTEYAGDLHSWANYLHLEGATPTVIGDQETQLRTIRGETQPRLASIATMGYVNDDGQLTNYGYSFGADRTFYNPTPYNQYGLLVRAHRPDLRSSTSDNIGYYNAFYASAPHAAAARDREW